VFLLEADSRESINMNTYPGKLGIKRNPNLDAAGARFEQKMAERVERNPDRYVDRYINANRARATAAVNGPDNGKSGAAGAGQNGNARGGLIVDVDRARKLFPEYDLSKKTRAKYSGPIHEVASAIAKAAFAKWVARPGDKPVAFVLGAGGSGKTFVIDKELMAELHALYDTQMARFGSSTAKIEAALTAGRNVLLFYIDRPPELAMAGIIDRSVETGRTIPIPVIAQNHASAQRTFLGLYEKYQDDPRVRFYVVDNPGGSEDVRSISIEELRARPQPAAGELEPKLRKVLDNERIRRARTATAIPDGIYSALSGNGVTWRAQPGAGPGDLGAERVGAQRVGAKPTGQTGGWTGQQDDSESEDERTGTGAEQAGRGAGDGSASASARHLSQQSPGADAQDSSDSGGDVQASDVTNGVSEFGRGGGGGRASAAQSGYADPSGGAAYSAAAGSGGEDGEAGVGDAETEGRGDAETEGHGDVTDSFDRYLNTDQAVRDYKKHFGKVISVDQAKELSPDYADSNSSRARLAGAVQEPAHKFAHRLYARELAKHALPGQQDMVLFTAGGTGAGKTSTIRNADGAKLFRDAQIVFDGTLHDYQDGVKLIDQALAAGKRVVIVAVHRDLLEAFDNGVLPRAARQGRPVPLDEHIETHKGIADALPRYVNRYQDNPRVQFVAIDNSRGPGGAVHAKPPRREEREAG
jgi:hypothetical protein